MKRHFDSAMPFYKDTINYYECDDYLTIHSPLSALSPISDGGHSMMSTPVSTNYLEPISLEALSIQESTAPIIPSPSINTWPESCVSSYYLHEFHNDGLMNCAGDTKIGEDNDLALHNTIWMSQTQRVGEPPQQDILAAITKFELDSGVEPVFAPQPSSSTLFDAFQTSYVEDRSVQSVSVGHFGHSQMSETIPYHQREGFSHHEFLDVKRSESPVNSPCVDTTCQTFKKTVEPPVHSNPPSQIIRKRKMARMTRNKGKEVGNTPSNFRIQKQSQRQCPREGCGRKFQRQEHLTRHMKIHMGLSAHPCLFCTKMFGRTDNLKSHIRLHSFPNKKFSRTSYHPEAAQLWAAMDRKSTKKKKENQVEINP